MSAAPAVACTCPDPCPRHGTPPIFCPGCGAPRTHDRLNGSVAYYCGCPGYGSAWILNLPAGFVDLAAADDAARKDGAR